MQKTKEIRHELYDYIDNLTIEGLTPEQKSFIHIEIMKHSNELSTEARKKIHQRGETLEKIISYITKAKTLPQSQTIKIQVDTLKLVQNWLKAEI